MAEGPVQGGAGPSDPDPVDVLAVHGHRWLTSLSVVGASARTLLHDLDNLDRPQIDSLLRSVIRHADRIEESIVELFSMVPPALPERREQHDVVDLRSAVVAQCSCGWRSKPMPTAVVAGEAWDRHVNRDGPAGSDRHDVLFGRASRGQG